jgi:hypothetical protein
MDFLGQFIHSKSSNERKKLIVVLATIIKKNKSVYRILKDKGFCAILNRRLYLCPNYKSKLSIDYSALKAFEPDHCQDPLFFSMPISQYPFGLVVPHNSRGLRRQLHFGDISSIPDPYTHFVWVSMTQREIEVLDGELMIGEVPEEEEELSLSLMSISYDELPKETWGKVPVIGLKKRERKGSQFSFCSGDTEENQGRAEGLGKEKDNQNKKNRDPELNCFKHKVEDVMASTKKTRNLSGVLGSKVKELLKEESEQEMNFIIKRGKKRRIKKRKSRYISQTSFDLGDDAAEKKKKKKDNRFSRDEVRLSGRGRLRKTKEEEAVANRKELAKSHQGSFFKGFRSRSKKRKKGMILRPQKEKDFEEDKNADQSTEATISRTKKWPDMSVENNSSLIMNSVHMSSDFYKKRLEELNKAQKTPVSKLKKSPKLNKEIKVIDPLKARNKGLFSGNFEMFSLAGRNKKFKRKGFIIKSLNDLPMNDSLSEEEAKETSIGNEPDSKDGEFRGLKKNYAYKNAFRIRGKKKAKKIKIKKAYNLNNNKFKARSMMMLGRDNSFQEFDFNIFSQKNTNHKELFKKMADRIVQNEHKIHTLDKTELRKKLNKFEQRTDAIYKRCRNRRRTAPNMYGN